jgi:hypothetical protein
MMAGRTVVGRTGLKPVTPCVSSTLRLFGTVQHRSAPFNYPVICWGLDQGHSRPFASVQRSCLHGCLQDFKTRHLGLGDKDR